MKKLLAFILFSSLCLAQAPNLFYSTLISTITSTDTIVTFKASDTTLAGSGTSYYATIWDTKKATPADAYKAGVAEIVLINSRTANRFDIERGQLGTTAINCNVSGHVYQISVGTYIETSILGSKRFNNSVRIDSLNVGSISAIGQFKIFESNLTNIDSNKTSGSNANWGVYSSAQSITGNGTKLGSVDFNIRKVGVPTGTIKAKLYLASGVYLSGTIIPTGSALDSSESMYAISLTTSYVQTKFTFLNQVSLTNGQQYCVALEYPTGWDGSNYIQIGYIAFGAYGGNIAGKSTVNGSWSANAAINFFFIAYRVGGSTSFVTATGSDRTVTIPNYSGTLLYNESDTSAFTTSLTRKVIYISGAIPSNKYIVTPRGNNQGIASEVLPVAGDLIMAIAKTDSVIFLRSAGTTSGLKFQYQRIR